MQEHTYTHTNTNTHTHTHTHTHTQTNTNIHKKVNARTTHNTPVHWAGTLDTHAEDVAGGICPLFFTYPEVLVLPHRQPGAVGSLLWRPGTKPSVSDWFMV